MKAMRIHARRLSVLAPATMAALWCVSSVPAAPQTKPKTAAPAAQAAAPDHAAPPAAHAATPAGRGAPAAAGRGATPAAGGRGTGGAAAGAGGRGTTAGGGRGTGGAAAGAGGRGTTAGGGRGGSGSRWKRLWRRGATRRRTGPSRRKRGTRGQRQPRDLRSGRPSAGCACARHGYSPRTRWRPNHRQGAAGRREGGEQPLWARLHCAPIRVPRHELLASDVLLQRRGIQPVLPALRVGRSSSERICTVSLFRPRLLRLGL